MPNAPEIIGQLPETRKIWRTSYEHLKKRTTTENDPVAPSQSRWNSIWSYRPDRTRNHGPFECYLPIDHLKTIGINALVANRLALNQDKDEDDEDYA